MIEAAAAARTRLLADNRICADLKDKVEALKARLLKAENKHKEVDDERHRSCIELVELTDQYKVRP